MRRRIACSLALLLAAAAANAQSADPRTPGGHPDFSGTYDVATLTPTQRPEQLGERLALSDEEAAAVAERARRTSDLTSQASDPDRSAPREGGNVGGYNYFWLDPGQGSFQLDGKWRTSILTDPPNGRYPPYTAHGEEAVQARLDRWGRSNDPVLNQNNPEAWWLDRQVGPFDAAELRPMGERCVLGFGSAGGPPMLPVLYNNLKRIVQTDDVLMILSEMIHDVRVIPIGGERAPEHVRRWLGDSVGRWEGDTLVVESTHFRAGESALSTPGTRQNFLTSEELRVTERFSRIDGATLRYQFTVEDPKIWTASWSGEYPWPVTEEKVYEYACHEANYAMGNILRGARLAEREAEERGGSEP